MSLHAGSYPSRSQYRHMSFDLAMQRQEKREPVWASAAVEILQGHKTVLTISHSGGTELALQLTLKGPLEP